MFADVQTDEQRVNDLTPWWRKRNRFDPTQGDSLDDEDNIELSPAQRVLGMDRGTMAPAGNDVRTTPPDSPELVSFPMPHDLTPPDTRLADAGRLAPTTERQPEIKFPGVAKYRKVVSEQPDPSQYKPSIGRRIAAAMATFGTELRAPGHGAELGESILNQPRDRAMADYQNRVKAAMNEMNADKEQADIERIGAQTEAFRGTDEERRARAEMERKKALNPPVTKETLQNLYAGAVKQAMDAGRDPSADPTVEKYRTAIQDLEKQGTKTETDKYIERFLAMGGLKDTPANRQKGFDEYNNKTRVLPGVTRLEILGNMRGPPVKDTKTNVTAPMNWNNYNRLSKEEPGRYVSPQFDFGTQMSLRAWRDLAPNGKTGQQLTSYDAFIRHVGNLYSVIAEMKNTNFPFINKPLNWLVENSGDPRVSVFMSKLAPPLKEFETFLLNNRALYQDDRDEGKKIFDVNKSPAAMFGVLPSLVETGADRMAATNKTFHRATQGHNIPALISKEALAVMKRLNVAPPARLPEGNEEEGEIPSAPPASPTARPAPAAPQGQKVYTQADVDAYVKKTGQPASAFEDNLRAKGWKKQ